MLRGARKLLVQAAIVFALATAQSATAGALIPPSLDELVSVVPGAVASRHELRPLDFFAMLDADGRVVGAAFVTSHIPPVVSGYRGEIDVLVGIDAGGTITGAKVLAFNETPHIFKRVLDADFLQRFLGRRGLESFDDIEAITGATISSQAIIEDVRSATAAVAEQIVGSGALAAPRDSPRRWLPWAGGAAALLLAAGALAASLLPRRRGLRAMLLVLSVLVVGLWLNAPVTIGDLVDLRNRVLPSSAHLALLVLLLFAIAAALLRGNLYCAYLCPFGALQEGAARIGLPKCRPSSAADAAASWLRWVILIAAVYGIAAQGSEAVRTIEPFALLFSREPVMSALVQAGVVLISALVVRRVWCRFLCPTGLVLDLFAILGAKVRRPLAAWRRKCHEA